MIVLFKHLDIIKMKEIKNSPGLWYCYKSGERAIFLDRKDRLIKEFETFNEALVFANNNMNLIDRINP